MKIKYNVNIASGSELDETGNVLKMKRYKNEPDIDFRERLLSTLKELEKETIEYKLMHKDAVAPARGTEKSAGLDLCIAEDTTIQPNAVGLVRLGVGFNVPENYVMLLCIRSSTPKKKGIMLANSVGIIDEDYKGEVMALVHNIKNEEVTLEKGERLTQAVLVPTTYFAPVQVEELTETERGAGSFGSTNAK